MTSTKPSKAAAKSGISVKSRVKAGGISMQHNQAAKGLHVKSRVKAGEIVVTKSSDCSGSLL